MEEIGLLQVRVEVLQPLVLQVVELDHMLHMGQAELQLEVAFGRNCKCHPEQFLVGIVQIQIGPEVFTMN